MKEHSKEAHLLADSILKAAGSGLVQYTHRSMEKIRNDILDMAQAGIDSAREKFKGVTLTNSTTLSYPLQPQEYPAEIHIIKYQHGLTEVRETPNAYSQKYVRG